MAEEKKTDSSFRTRLRSALIAAPLVLAVLYAGGLAFTIMMAVAAAIGAYEWTRMVLSGQDKPPAALVPLSAVLTGLGAFSAGFADTPLNALFFLAALSFLIFAVNFSQKGPPVRLVVFGVIYIGFSISVMIWLRGGTSGQGLYYLATLLLLVWASDIFAYLTGKTLGGPKLAPKISPKKTWAGFIGSSVGAGGVCAALALPTLTQKMEVDTLGNMGPAGYFVMGFILAMFGQGGDLLISVFKRHFNVKDTGSILPGHGGILDRIDALLFVALIYGSIVMVLA